MNSLQVNARGKAVDAFTEFTYYRPSRFGSDLKTAIKSFKIHVSISNLGSLWSASKYGLLLFPGRFHRDEKSFNKNNRRTFDYSGADG